MLFIYAKPESVLTIILTEVQREHNVKLNSEKWEVAFPKENPIVRIKLMRVDPEQICVDFCKVWSDQVYFDKWVSLLKEFIAKEAK